MQVTRDNYSQYANMVQQMFGNKKNSNDPLAQCDYGNFALRFKPVDIQFAKPNWDNIMTKRDKPAMSEEEFEAAIKELAQKEFATGSGMMPHTESCVCSMGRRFPRTGKPSTNQA